ncbi:MAG: hypothetical protein K2X69_05445, partial [Silvanigrellaceae bacterium]|nr:hypothetical protein [Silvanigrellaceae bacterium]
MAFMSGITFGFGVFFGFIGAIFVTSIVCGVLYFLYTIAVIFAWLPYYIFIGEDTEEMQQGYKYLLGFIIFIILCIHSYTSPFMESLFEFLN